MLTSCFAHGDSLRSRCVSDRVLTGKVDVPMPPARVVADWQRETSSHMVLEAGDVEVMPLARTQMRWPDYTSCVQAMSEWTRSLGLGDVLASSDVTLMACRGARYHHDAVQYGGAAFCNLFLTEDKGMDTHFAAIGQRIPLMRGTAMIFDTAQPHGVIARDSSRFDAADFPANADYLQIFLTWELPIEDARVARALGVSFDIAAMRDVAMASEDVYLNGERVVVCPETGRWQSRSESEK